jgi:hypothetical protein
MQRVKGTSKHERNVFFYKRDEDKNIINCYSAFGYSKVTPEQIAKLKANPLTSVDFPMHSLSVESLKDQYEEFIERADKLKKITDGKINLYKTGRTGTTALQLFYDLCKPPIAETIEKYEIDILEKCQNGFFIYGDDGYEGKGYKYDVVSQYASVMKSTSISFPTKKGVLTTITQQKFDDFKFLPFGVYHLIITGYDSRLFKANPENWYTHIDVNRAKELKYKIDLIENDENNLLYYGDRINGARLFGPYVNFLFPLKQAGHKEIKPFLTCLWGKICESYDIEVTLSKEQPLFASRDIVSIMPASNDINNVGGKQIALVQPKEKVYNSSYARIKPFLMAKCRLQMSKIVEPNLQNLVRIYADGIILKKRVEDVETGDKLGNLKFEGKCKKMVVKNARDIIGTFKI